MQPEPAAKKTMTTRKRKIQHVKSELADEQMSCISKAKTENIPGLPASAEIADCLSDEEYDPNQSFLEYFDKDKDLQAEFDERIKDVRQLSSVGQTSSVVNHFVPKRVHFHYRAMHTR